MKTLVAPYRILTSERLIKYCGTVRGSWFSLDDARKLVDRSKGEMIYEYSYDIEPLWEVF